MISRKGNICLYQQNQWEEPIYYAVFRLRIKPAHDYHGKHWEPYEVMPSGEGFGKGGNRNLRNFNDALDQFNILLKREELNSKKRITNSEL